jgi:hypothetical protein
MCILQGRDPDLVNVKKHDKITGRFVRILMPLDSLCPQISPFLLWMQFKYILFVVFQFVSTKNAPVLLENKITRVLDSVADP